MMKRTREEEFESPVNLLYPEKVLKHLFMARKSSGGITALMVDERTEPFNELILYAPDGVTSLYTYTRDIPDDVAKAFQLLFTNVEDYFEIAYHKFHTEMYLRWTNLRKIELMETDITTLPDEIRNMHSLACLRLTQNRRLETLPDTLVQCTQLRKLFIDGHALKFLPRVVTNLCGLVKLQVEGRNLDEWPDLTKLTKLEVLHIAINFVESEPLLPPSLLKLRNLSRLLVASNFFDPLPERSPASAKDYRIILAACSTVAGALPLSSLHFYRTTGKGYYLDRHIIHRWQRIPMLKLDMECMFPPSEDIANAKLWHCIVNGVKPHWYLDRVTNPKYFRRATAFLHVIRERKYLENKYFFPPLDAFDIVLKIFLRLCYNPDDKFVHKFERWLPDDY